MSSIDIDEFEEPMEDRIAFFKRATLERELLPREVYDRSMLSKIRHILTSYGAKPVFEEESEGRPKNLPVGCYLESSILSVMDGNVVFWSYFVPPKVEASTSDEIIRFGGLFIVDVYSTRNGIDGLDVMKDLRKFFEPEQDLQHS